MANRTLVRLILSLALCAFSTNALALARTSIVTRSATDATNTTITGQIYAVAKSNVTIPTKATLFYADGQIYVNKVPKGRKIVYPLQNCTIAATGQSSIQCVSPTALPAPPAGEDESPWSTTKPVALFINPPSIWAGAVYYRNVGLVDASRIEGSGYIWSGFGRFEKGEIGLRFPNDEKIAMWWMKEVAGEEGSWNLGWVAGRKGEDTVSEGTGVQLFLE